MNSVTLRRLLVVLAITLGSLFLIFPTIRYFLAISDVVPVEEQKLAELKGKSVPLGLDLQGGVDVLLAVDTQATEFAKVNEYANDIRNAFTNESPAIEGSVETTSGSRNIVVNVVRQDQVRAADNALQKIAEDTNAFSYSSGSIQANVPLQITVDSSVLTQDMHDTVDSSIRVIRDRVDSLGVTQPVIIKQGTDRMRVQIPGEKDPEKAISTMIRPARLEFRGVYTTEQPMIDEKGEEYWPEASGQIIDTATGDVLEGQRIPPGYTVMKHRVTVRGERGQAPETVTRHMVVKSRPEMTGAGLKDARVQMGQGGLNAGEVEVVVLFNDTGTKQFDEISQRYLKQPLAVILDDVVYSAPIIQGRISGGYCSITGSFTLEEGKDLSLVLKAGALPAELITMDMRTVEATLGEASISQSVMALFLGSLLVGLYMIVYYGGAGVVAVIAVIINVILVFTFMKLASATLTLSGIGGILLTVGMAVDANVLIYERVREELRDGKTTKQAIQLGFGKAFSVIFDANLTTLISGLVLLQFGTGSVQGFALTLNVGIIATLFTGLFVTKTLVDVWFELRGNIGFGKLAWFKDGVNFDFLKLRKGAYILSGGLITVCLVYIMPFAGGSNWGVDFEGGLLTEASIEAPVGVEELQSQNEGWRVQKVSGENQFLIRTKLAHAEQTLAEAQAAVEQSLEATVGAGKYTILSSEAVSNQVGKEFTLKAFMACLLASLCIGLYLAFRFEWIFGVTAVIALLHDVVASYGIFNMMGDMRMAGEVTLDVVAALLVVLGYSVNDTIIIFDRIRENRKIHPSMSDYEMINLSVNESLNRTIVTLTTILVVLFILLFVGGSGLYDFALVLTLGITLGTFSSIFLAAPLIYFFHEHARKKGKRIAYRDTEKRELNPMLRER